MMLLFMNKKQLYPNVGNDLDSKSQIKPSASPCHLESQI